MYITSSFKRRKDRALEQNVIFLGVVVSKTWALEDVTKIAKEAPYTIYLPSAKVVSQLKKDDIVKLMFSCDVENDKGWSAERMWVIISEKNGNDFIGELNNEPYYIPDIKLGDSLKFILI